MPASEGPGVETVTAGPQLPRLNDTERAIYSAARDLLAAGGLDALSMRAVAARVGTTPTAIYHYFPSKEDLVERVVLRGFQQSEAHLWRAIEPLEVGSLERLAALGEAYIRFAVEHHQYFKIIFGIQTACPRELDDVPGRGGYGVLRQCVVDAMDRGTIRKADPDVVVLYLWSVVHGLVTIFMACESDSMLGDTSIAVPEGVSAPEHLFQRFREIMESGLVTRPGDGASPED